MWVNGDHRHVRQVDTLFFFCKILFKESDHCVTDQNTKLKIYLELSLFCVMVRRKYTLNTKKRHNYMHFLPERAANSL